MTAPPMRITPPYTPELLRKAALRIRTFLRDRHLPDVLELGSGWSTIWFAKHCKASVFSLEHDRGWYEAVWKAVEAENRDLSLDVSLLLVEAEKFPGTLTRLTRRFDVVYIDCIDEQRNECALLALDRLKPGGWLVLDDTHWDSWAPVLASPFLQRLRRRVYRGRHRRKDGTMRYHHTTIYEKS